MPLPKELKELWIQKLRSGEYKQGIAKLRQGNNEFCCLGVLCDISGEGKWIPENKDPIGNRFYYYSIENSVTGGVLPSELSKKYGFDLTGEFIDEKGEIHSLVGLNDSGKTFAEIADVIEKYF